MVQNRWSNTGNSTLDPVHYGFSTCRFWYYPESRRCTRCHHCEYFRCNLWKTKTTTWTERFFFFIADSRNDIIKHFSDLSWSGVLAIIPKTTCTFLCLVYVFLWRKCLFPFSVQVSVTRIAEHATLLPKMTETTTNPVKWVWQWPPWLLWRNEAMTCEDVYQHCTIIRGFSKPENYVFFLFKGIVEDEKNRIITQKNKNNPRIDPNCLHHRPHICNYTELKGNAPKMLLKTPRD